MASVLDLGAFRGSGSRMVRPASDLSESLAELRDIVLQASGGGVPARELAQRYTVCRQTLLQETDRATLPGFLIQCVSINKFVEFITLFHPDVGARRAFLLQQFGTPHTASRPAGRIDIFDDPL